MIALVPRAAVALAWAGEPVWDGHYYDFGARRIAAGLGYSDDRAVGGRARVASVVPLPGRLQRLPRRSSTASSARVTPSPPWPTRSTGAALAVVTWALARHALSTGRARAAGLLVALHPGLILYAALVMTEPLAALLTLAAFWLAVRDAAADARARCSARSSWAWRALVRPQALLCAPFLARPRRRALATARGRRRGRAARSRSCPCCPWTARNCRVMDGCALVSTNAGWNLAIGAFPRATGRFETLHASDGCRDVTGQVEQDRCWLHYGLGEIAARPWRWLALVPAKLGFTFDHESFAVEYLHEARPEAWPQADARAGARGHDAGAPAPPRRGGARRRRVPAHAQRAHVRDARDARGVAVQARAPRGRRRPRLARAVERLAVLLAARPLCGHGPVVALARAARESARDPARSRLARDDRDHARRIFRRGPISHRRHAGARAACRRGVASRAARAPVMTAPLAHRASVSRRASLASNAQRLPRRTQRPKREELCYGPPRKDVAMHRSLAIISSLAAVVSAVGAMGCSLVNDGAAPDGDAARAATPRRLSRSRPT